MTGTEPQVIESRVDGEMLLQGYVERVSRTAVHGWARDPHRPQSRLTIEAVVDGIILASAEAAMFRGDVADAGHGDGRCGFRLDLSAHALALGNRILTVRVAGTAQIVAGTPRRFADNPGLVRILGRDAAMAHGLRQRLTRMMHHRARGRGISIVLQVGDTSPERLAGMLRGLLGQWCPNWEAVCIADAPQPGQAGILAAARDPRLRILTPGVRLDISAAMDFGLRAARHDHVLFLTAPARLEPDAVHHLLAASAGREALLYWDDAVTHTDRYGITEAVCRGAYSPDGFRSEPDLGAGFCVPASLARSVGGWRGDQAGFVTRLLEAAPVVGHLPRILTRLWVTGAGGPGDGGTRLAGIYPKARVAKASGEICIVIATRNEADLLRRCIDSVRATANDVAHRIVVIDHQSDEPATRQYLKGAGVTVLPYEGPFNFAAMNNRAIRECARSAEFVLFLNNDTEALQPGWLERLRGLAARPEVGAVGALLLYGDLRVQHAGVVVGVGGAAGHALVYDQAYRDGVRLPGPQGLLTSLRDVSAVTAACMMMRHSVFADVGGFDEAFPVGFNDTDLCLRLRRRGLRVLYDGQTVLLHHESYTRRQTGQLLHRADTRRFQRRWRRRLQDGDPYYNPQLGLIAADWELREDCGPPGAVRIVGKPGHGA